MGGAGCSRDAGWTGYWAATSTAPGRRQERRWQQRVPLALASPSSWCHLSCPRDASSQCSKARCSTSPIGSSVTFYSTDHSFPPPRSIAPTMFLPCAQSLLHSWHRRRSSDRRHCCFRFNFSLELRSEYPYMRDPLAFLMYKIGVWMGCWAIVGGQSSSRQRCTVK